MTKRNISGMAVLGAVLLILSACAKQERSSAGQATSPGESQNIAWLNDYDTAIKTASQGKKLVMIDFYTDW